MKLGDAIGLGIGYAALLWWQKRYPPAAEPENGIGDYDLTELGPMFEAADLCFPMLDPSCAPPLPPTPTTEQPLGQPDEPIDFGFTPYTPPENGGIIPPFQYDLPEIDAWWLEESNGMGAQP